MAHRQQDLHQQAGQLTTATALSWPLSIFSAILTGIVGMLAAGAVAAACVDWYNVSSREGASGYFVIAIAFLGFVAGVVIGVVMARVVAAGTHPGFLKALGRSLAIVAGLTIVGGGTARLLADVPPEIDGESLMLSVEVRWPEDQVERPATGPAGGSLTLHSIPFYSHTVRASETGALWMEDAHRVDGRWVVPGAVSVFTSRGKRALLVSTSDDDPTAHEGFLVPLPARPGAGQREWSEWLPRPREGVAPINRLTYRFRVRRTSEPVRTQVIGDWEVGTAASAFYRQQVNGQTVTSATATFTLQHRGKAVSFDSSGAEPALRIDDIALLARPETAFLVHADQPGATGRNFLVSADGGQLRIAEIGESYSATVGEQLTPDTARFRALRHREHTSGEVDRTTYDEPGLYLVGTTVVDTRSLALHPFTPDTTASAIPSIPPLDLSPDGRSFVAFANEGYPSEGHVLVVTNFIDNRSYILPVDEARMRYADFDALDPAWIRHHFEWKRGSDGADQLVERAGFTPLPYHGTLSVETNGDRTYRIEKATDSLRPALISFLQEHFQAQPQPADTDAYEVPVKIGERVLNVAHSSGTGYLLVSLQEQGADTTLVPEIARQFNEALATGRYDSMFGR